MDLSKSDRKLLEKTWPKDEKERVKIGAQIYARMFELDSSLIDLFSYGKDDNFMESDQFQKQALNLIGVVNEGVEEAAKCESGGGLKYLADLRALGKNHIRFTEEGFHPDHWVTFEKSINEIIIGRITDDTIDESEKKKISDAWKKLVKMIIDTMKAGYYGYFAFCE